MENQEKYFFEDFTIAEYEKLLVAAKAHYEFAAFTDLPSAKKFIVWRHDVDLSLHRALQLAQIENAHNIKATYLLLPHSEFYNLFDSENSDLVKKIINLGHDVGLHFDSHFYGIENVSQLEKYLLREKRWIDETYGTDIKAFSFHNTTPFTMSCKQWQYAGLINTYAEMFQTNVGYCSDSHGIWRFRRLLDLLQSGEEHSLQVLTHPEWWVEEVMSPRQRIQRCITGRALATAKFYDEGIAKMNRENIDW
ncbi:MAG: hypothetical protein ABI723_19700 [Bacteroidia bacterium]